MCCYFFIFLIKAEERAGPLELIQLTQKEPKG